MFRAGGGPVAVRMRPTRRRWVVRLQAGRRPDPVRQLPKVLARIDDFRIEIIGLLTLIEANTECTSGVQDRLSASKWMRRFVIVSFITMSETSLLAPGYIIRSLVHRQAQGVEQRW